MKHVASLALAGLMSLAFGQAALAQHQGEHLTVVPSEIKWSAVPSLPPGAEIAVLEGPLNKAGPITARLKFPAKYRIPPHTHPAIEHVTVLSGTFHIGHGDKLDMSKGTALPAGGFVVIPVGSAHFAWTEEETVVQLHSIGPWGVTYINPADDPRKK